MGRFRGPYGALSVGHGATEGAHRLSFAFVNAKSPYPDMVLHHCDNPACCNAAHLFLGTTQDNTADKMAKGRHRCAPQRGEHNPRARLTGDQVGQIRERILAGETNTAIVADYGVTHGQISLIRRGKSWGLGPIDGTYDSLRHPQRRAIS